MVGITVQFNCYRFIGLYGVAEQHRPFKIQIIKNFYSPIKLNTEIPPSLLVAPKQVGRILGSAIYRILTTT